MKLHRRLLLLAAVSLAFASPHAQRPQPAPAFETASIHPRQPSAMCYSVLPSGSTHYAVTCITLGQLIALAWKTSQDDIQGGDARVLGVTYDFSATTPGETPWTMETLRPMLQQFLIERFHLAVHPGTKQVSGYGLFVAKSGPKLKPAKAEDGSHGIKAGEPAKNFYYPGHLQGRAMNPEGIAGLLTLPLHAPVADHTGLTGIFNIDLSFAPENSTDSPLPSLFTALEEQLGLKLQAEKVPVNTLIIDHVDAEPTAN